MKITVHLREGPNKTNMRSECIIPGLEAAGHKVKVMGRGDYEKDSDLVIQTGFGASRALQEQIEANKPYLIMEAPFWRDFYPVHTCSSWNYNGLAGGAYAPEPPEEPRPAPELLPMVEDVSRTLIIGQKPTDHSLRGTDHVQWILDKKKEYPEADFRPHPLMVPAGTLAPFRDVLMAYDQIITFTSTSASEALVAGRQVQADHPGNLAYGVTDREKWHHATSWRHAPHSEMHELVPHILSGYEEARARAEQGLFEIPRGRVDGQAVCQRYYNAGL